MKLEFVPLLKTQRELYNIPRGMERFRTYLNTMIDGETNDLKLPLIALNPMGKSHVPALLDQYLEFEADRLAAQAVSEAESQLTGIPGVFKVALVISDDAMGQWTNRYTTEFSHRFESKPLFRRGWLTGILWTSEKPSAQAVREELLMAVFRGAYIQQHGFAKTFGEMLAQEGYAMVMAGCKQPDLDVETLAYTREVLGLHFDTTDYSIMIGGLFGDEAAFSLGYSPLGLDTRAGLALARQDSS